MPDTFTRAEQLAYLIGIDEAGYGPNLGPLVVGGTAWRLPDALLSNNLYDELAGAVVRTAAEASAGELIAVADSKQLYAPRGSLALLERGVLAAAAVAKHSQSAMKPLLAGEEISWRDLIASLASSHSSDEQNPVWETTHQSQLTIDCDANQLMAAALLLRDQSKQTGVSLQRIAAAIVQPAEFNRLTETHGNKAGLLSEISLRLAQSLAAESMEETVLICCDKHGGRNRYAGFLQSIFGVGLITVVTESRPASVYRFRLNKQQIEIRFSARGESQLAVAWASMTAKYLRELAMKAFNAFWKQHLPDLKPTAGYPQDAKRFRGEIASLQKKLKISDNDLWRNR